MGHATLTVKRQMLLDFSDVLVYLELTWALCTIAQMYPTYGQQTHELKVIWIVFVEEWERRGYRTIPSPWGVDRVCDVCVPRHCMLETSMACSGV